MIAKEMSLDAGAKRRGSGKITRKRGSNKLYVDFVYLSRRIEKSLGCDDTPINREKAEAWLTRKMVEIENGTFRFAATFPHASEKEKALFAQLEGWIYKPEPEHILFGSFLENWVANDLQQMSHSTRIDYQSSINPWIRPFFSEMTFFHINSSVVNKFISILVHPRTEAEELAGTPAKPLTQKRIKNILSHLRMLWDTACGDNRWDLPSPFPEPKKRRGRAKQCEVDVRAVKDMVVTDHDLVSAHKRALKADRLPLRFEEWLSVYSRLDAWTQPIALLMLLTGMITSELAGLCPGHIANGYIHVRQIVSRGKVYPYPKTDSRVRDIRITKRIQAVLDILTSRPKGTGPFIITRESGLHYNHTEFGRKWRPVVKATGINYRVPYCLRHTFAAWSLCIGIDNNRLVWLMGHATKEMVYEVYGKYIEGLEQDRNKILTLFGEDFIDPLA